ncbi:hypothetical protein GCM10022405_20780 [Gibbsiella dentisursi]|uniref:Uncharacterized protein n=1 Tax=Gibbsiella dentisursi TaxID=796890 RepID=A0ABP7L586_9GAMM
MSGPKARPRHPGLRLTWPARYAGTLAASPSPDGSATTNIPVCLASIDRPWPIAPGNGALLGSPRCALNVPPNLSPPGNLTTNFDMG